MLTMLSCDLVSDLLCCPGWSDNHADYKCRQFVYVNVEGHAHRGPPGMVCYSEWQKVGRSAEEMEQYDVSGLNLTGPPAGERRCAAKPVEVIKSELRAARDKAAENGDPRKRRRLE